MSEIGGKNLEILGEVMAKPLVTTVEEVETQIKEKDDMQNAPTNVDMERS
jgi:hypothetical protein